MNKNNTPQTNDEGKVSVLALFFYIDKNTGEQQPSFVDRILVTEDEAKSGILTKESVRKAQICDDDELHGEIITEDFLIKCFNDFYESF